MRAAPGPLASLSVDVLVVGSGGREHALAAAFARDPSVTRLFCAPGNAGIAEVAELHPVDATDPAAVTALALRLAVDLVVVGPEAPLAAGVADAVRAAGLVCFGPSAAAARLESSKAFAKEVMAGAGVPTAASAVFTDAASCAAHLRSVSAPYVVKADGLAAGKGVHVGTDLAAAEAFASDVLAAPGAVVLVEDFLDGPEVSVFAVSDGTAVVALLPSQDHKRVGDGDTGPNTGGMGAYAPVPWLPAGTLEDIVASVVQPVVDEMRRRGTPFTGLLYAGLAMTSRGPQVVEFNCRFGDPETQAVLALLDSPLSELLLAAATGRLASCPPPRWRAGAAVTVVVAAHGYPQHPRLGDRVDIGPLPAGVAALHAGTARAADGSCVSAGGRVLSVTAVAGSLGAARELAYEGVRQVRLAGSHARTDIADRAARGEIAVPAEVRR